MDLYIEMTNLGLCSYWIIIQWRSQDIADARAQHGHTTFVLQTSARLSAEDIREVWRHPPPENYSPPGPFGRQQTKVRLTYETRDSVHIHGDTAPFDFKAV